MELNEPNIALISYCGLYRGECPSFKKGKCPGCAKNDKATWCKVRSCNISRGINSCADCDEYDDIMNCKKYNNFISKLFALVLNSDRHKGILYIKEFGYPLFAHQMTDLKRVSLKRN